MTEKKPLLGLNIIVAPDENDILERCLNSCKGDLFDEIVVTLGTPGDVPELRAVAEKFGAKTFHFKWCDDFSAARNFSFSKNTSEYIMWCLTPDSLVHTDRGLRPIFEIEVGDKVLTHTGRYMPVTKTYCQPYSGEIIRVSGKYSKGSVGVTPNHEFYGCKSYRCKTGLKFCKADCKKQYSKRYLKKYGKICLQCRQGYTGYDKQYTAIDQYVEGDIVTLPRLKQIIFNPYFLHLPEKEKARHDLPKTVEVTPELMRLFGYYVAEGTQTDNYISFCFHKNETSYHKDVMALMEKFFGLTGRSYLTKSNGCNITYNSIVLSDFFRELFNGVQPQRRIPNEFLGLSDQHLSEFIKGYYRGDGGENPDSFAMTTTSPYLVEQVLLILTRFGIMGEVIPYKAKVAWKVRVGGKSVAIFQELISEIHSKFLTSEFNKYFYADSSFIYHQIEEYQKETYEGNVYNLEVEEDHSYVADYMITHNCDADDVIKPEEYKKLLELKPKLRNWDIVVLDYVYSHDEKDNPVLVLPRERIVKNCDHIKWHDPIHEYMNLDVPAGRLARFHISIDHYRLKSHNPARNIEALKKVYDTGKSSERIKFYYGKELADFGMWDKAIEVLEPYIKDGNDFADNLTTACIKLSRHYLEKGILDKAKTYALTGIRFNSIYAECYVILGNVFEQEKDSDTAISYYKEALSKKLEGGMSQIVDYYNFIPAAKLSLIYFGRKEYEEALNYCELALKHKPDNEHMKDMHSMLTSELERLSKSKVINDETIDSIQEFLKKHSLSMSILRNNTEFCDIRLKSNMEAKVAWLVPHMNTNDPGVRIRRINVSNQLSELGVKSTIITDYYGSSVFEVRNSVDDANVAIFTQFGKEELEILRHLKKSGIKCVFDHCEALFNFPYQNEFMGEVDLIACCSTKLEELTREHGFMKTVVLKDAVEKTSDAAVYEDRYTKPKAVYVGMGGNSWLVNDWLRDSIEQAGYELVTITEWDNATKRWGIDTWMNDMLECDVVLCPQRVDVQPAKSSVKATVAMALGLPVLCSPLQAYMEIIKDGENGFICDTKEQWKKALIMLKDSSLREKIGKAGKESVKDFMLPAIAGQWKSTLDNLINGKLSFVEPEKKVETTSRAIVDIIIANYNNVEYLKMCVSSILMNTLYPYHIIISDGGSNEETWEYLRTLKGITVIGDPKVRLSFSETCNAGIRASNTKYFVILNSDVIVSKCWLTSLVNKMESVNRLASCGVLSNCDRGWRFK